MDTIKNIIRRPWITLVFTGIIGAAFGFAVGWRLHGSHSEATIAKIHQQSAEDVARALAQARSTEQKLQSEADTLIETYQKEQKNAQNTIEKLRADLRVGTLRLSVPRTDTPDTMPTDPATQHPENRTRLDLAVADTLVTITADGDTAIRNLNRCIDQYSAIRKAWNTK